MTRLTRAELVDLVRRLVESLGQGGLSRATVIEAENALKAEAADETELWRPTPGGAKTRNENGCELMVWRERDWHDRVWWGWTLFRETPDFYDSKEGHAATEHEAQTAALDAARRLA